MSLRLAACLATTLVLGAASASALPTHDQQRDRATVQKEVGALHEDSAELRDLNARIHALAVRINHERGDQKRADVAQEHELQARAARVRAQSHSMVHDEHAVMQDYHQDRATPH